MNRNNPFMKSLLIWSLLTTFIIASCAPPPATKTKPTVVSPVQPVNPTINSDNIVWLKEDTPANQASKSKRVLRKTKPFSIQFLQQQVAENNFVFPPNLNGTVRYPNLKTTYNVEMESGTVYSVTNQPIGELSINSGGYKAVAQHGVGPLTLTLQGTVGLSEDRVVKPDSPLVTTTDEIVTTGNNCQALRGTSYFSRNDGGAVVWPIDSASVSVIIEEVKSESGTVTHDLIVQMGSFTSGYTVRPGIIPGTCYVVSAEKVV